jgi:hypothetical protein
MSGKPQHKRHRLPQSMDQASAITSDVYSDSASLISAVQLGAQYRLSGASAVKPEPEGFSLMRNLPGPVRSNGSSADRNNPVTPEAQQQQLSSPIAGLVSPTVAQQQQQQRQRQQQSFSPGALSFNELQSIDFLQSLNSSATTSDNNNAGAATGTDGVDFSGLADIQMDLGFGLGWDGSDGQQLDLFDGFFFGGGLQLQQQRQQGGGDGGDGGLGQGDGEI